ncbi:MAG: RNA 2',3'-cyclic phosphodiesterase [Anaerolineaceae bacterium]|nr:RNA 2',3'-cyclic phosphodiesterase [Anaerolineaceae bacterium]
MTQNILNLIKEMRQYFPLGNLRWVKPDNSHITLKFLGNVPLEGVDTLREAINITALNSFICSVFIGGLGAYPSIDCPRTIWLSADPNQNLLDLYKNLNFKLDSSGFPKDNTTFKPHITLARVSDKLPLHEVNAISSTLKTIKIQILGNTRFGAINLLKSDLARTGPTYTILHTANLTPVP